MLNSARRQPLAFSTQSMAALRVLAVLIAASLLAGIAMASPTLDRIKATGTVTFGFRDAAPPFSVRQRNGQVRGYSVELCERVAAALGKSLGLPALKVVWVPVDSETRISAVASGKVDAECGTTTMTLSRMERVDFSLPIFVDGGSALVAPGASVKTVADLAGKRVAVIPATTTETALKRTLAVTGGTATLVPVKDGAAGIAALRAGKADAYASDRMLLAQLKDADAKGAELAFLDNDFSFEPYALVLPRNDADFRLLVNRALTDLYKSGGIDPIFIRWLGPYGRPGPLLNAMYYLNALPE
jgi:ABC-type amino acid transport substrate-binding protein